MNIAVVGAGGAGAVFSMILSKNGHTVTILAPDAEQAKNLSETHVSPWLKDLTLPQDIEYTADPAVVTGVSDCRTISFGRIHLGFRRQRY